MRNFLKYFNIFKLFKTCWMGEAPLYKAFWIVYVLFSLIYIFFMDFLIDIFVAGEFTPFFIHNQYSDRIISLSFPYVLFGAICVWICSKNSWFLWRILSRIIVFIPIVVATFHLTRPF